MQISTMSPGNPFILGSKVKGTSHKRHFQCGCLHSQVLASSLLSYHDVYYHILFLFAEVPHLNNVAIDESYRCLS